MNVVIFSGVQLLVTAYALWRGGGPERAAALALVLAGLATLAIPYDAASYRHVYWALFWIDVALFAGLVVIASVADRFWPLWLAALQLIAVANHGVRGYDQALVAPAYWLIAGKIAYPMLLLLLMGTVRHRQRLAAGLPEFALTRTRHADERRAAQAAPGQPGGSR